MQKLPGTRSIGYTLGFLSIFLWMGKGANLAGFVKVADAMIAYGVI